MAGVRTDSVGMHVAKGEFGWDGAVGAYVMRDLDNHVRIFYATHIRKYGEYLYENLYPTIRNAVYRELRKNCVVN